MPRPGAKHSLWWALVLSSLSVFSAAAEKPTFPFTAYLRESFESLFHDRCDKYTFVQQFARRLEQPAEKQLMFVYQEPYLRNGGLGDRLGGLISAVALSLRFNRTLVLRDHSGLHELFRPYHPEDIKSAAPKYRWDNYADWSGYRVELANNDATEYDLWDCINNHGSKNAHCSMLHGDVSQPIVLYRSNRAYLCFFHSQRQSAAEREMREILGVDARADLFEVAGCMLRLALWPTDRLWEEVEKAYGKYASEIKLNDLVRRFTQGEDSSAEKPAKSLSPSHLPSRSPIPSPSPALSRNASAKQTSIPPSLIDPLSADSLSENISVMFNFTSFNLREGHNANSRREMRRDEGRNRTRGRLRDRRLQQVQVSLSAVSEQEKSRDRERDREKGRSSHYHSRHIEPVFFQLGMHFRCGDMNYIKGGQNDACTYAPEREQNFLTGHPYGIGSCAREALQNHTQQLIQRRRPIVLGNGETLFRRSLRAASELEPQFILVFVTSDNEAAARQMGNTAHFPYTMYTPRGCHVELDQSKECHTFTVTQWFSLAMSNVLVTQTLPGPDAPTSSFSRYAGIYGLRYDPFRNGKQCALSKTNVDMHLLQQSNWFC